MLIGPIATARPVEVIQHNYPKTDMASILPKSLFSNLGRLETEQPLPGRVRELVVQQEMMSERLIGWVQLALAATFAVLYALSPRPADAPMTMYEPVPIALGAYALFTIGRLILSYRGHIPGWLLVLSILLDMTLLIGLIWSFHIQYGQPAAFSLKVPTFIYLFVFIALRALRFDHRFVLTAGLAAAAGWTLLFAFALQTSGPGDVTRNFIEYVTSNKILRGAEFDKIFSILMITGILTIAVWRARRTLFTAVRESAATRDMRRFLSEGLAETITSSEAQLQAGEAAERDAAILMLDIRGFTLFSSDRAPQDVVKLLTGYHARIVPLIEAHNGVIDKFMGDGVMATFGALAPSEHAAADALSALEAIIAETEKWRADLPAAGVSVPLDVNAAVAAGPVVFATLGSVDRLEYTVIGEAVNLTAKLEKHNKVLGTRALVSGDTFQKAIAGGYEPTLDNEAITKSTVAGVAAPLDLVALSAQPLQLPSEHAIVDVG